MHESRGPGQPHRSTYEYRTRLWLGSDATITGIAETRRDWKRRRSRSKRTNIAIAGPQPVYCSDTNVVGNPVNETSLDRTPTGDRSSECLIKQRTQKVALIIN